MDIEITKAATNWGAQLISFIVLTSLLGLSVALMFLVWVAA